MIEAYKIGITLALKDDVSVGLAQIQKNLAATDQAVQGTGQHLTLLQRLGRDMTAPNRLPQAAPAMRLATSDIAPPTEVGSAQASGKGVSEIAAPVSGIAARGFAALVPDQRRNFPPREADFAIPDYSAEFAALGRRLAMMGHTGESVQSPESVSLEQAPGLRRTPPTSMATDMADIGSRIGVPPSGDVASAGAREREAVASLEPAIQPAPRMPTPLVASAPEALRSFAAPMAPNPPPEVTAPASYTMEAAAPTRMPVRSIAPIAVQEMRPLGPLDPAMQARSEPLRQEREDRREDDEAQIQHGELIIDGEVLGRWLVERMTRAMTRPPAGMTGFDPRMTPVYAGANIGI